MSFSRTSASRGVRKHAWALLLALVAILLFYWYELRPIIVFRRCAQRSSMDARTLLASKAELSKGTAQGDSYVKLREKNLYLRSDYESFLLKCLTHNGLQIVPLDDSQKPKEEAEKPAEETK